MPILAGALHILGGNLTITGSEMLRDGLSGFEGEGAGRPLYLIFSPRPIALSRCVAYFWYIGTAHIYLGAALSLTNNKDG